jgi:hypothetical protein
MQHFKVDSHLTINNFNDYRQTINSVIFINNFIANVAPNIILKIVQPTDPLNLLL